MGLGHDGVTGEGAGVVSFPIAHVDTSWIDRDVAGIKDTPYWESVEVESTPFLVQMRDGPATALSGDTSAYVTRDTTVREVMTAGGDLLDWEARIKKAHDGAVVHLPGGSMLSHYAVHAVVRGLPVVFTKDAPRIGDTLKANTTAPTPQYADVARGLAFGTRVEPRNVQDSANAIYAAVMATHQVSAMANTTDGALAVGMGVGFMLRTATATLLGEMRHKLPDMPRARDVVYTKALNTYSKSRNKLREAWHVFYNGSWVQGFGGKKWANIAMAAIALDGAALAFAKRPGKREFNAMIADLHTLLNAVHNNGSWMSKFTGNNPLDDAASGRIASILKGAYAFRPWVAEARGAALALWAKRALKRPVTNEKADVRMRLQAGYKKLWVEANVKAPHASWQHGIKVISNSEYERLSRVLQTCEPSPDADNAGYMIIGPVEMPYLPRKAKQLIKSLGVN